MHQYAEDPTLYVKRYDKKLMTIIWLLTLPGKECLLCIRCMRETGICQVKKLIKKLYYQENMYPEIKVLKSMKRSSRNHLKCFVTLVNPSCIPFHGKEILFQ